MRSVIRLALLTLAVSTLPITAQAQSGGTQSRPGIGRPAAPQPNNAGGADNARSAPNGHRQPTENSLPPSVRHEERGRAPVDPLGPLPKICKDC